MAVFSSLAQNRLSYCPSLPVVLEDLSCVVPYVSKEVEVRGEIAQVFPNLSSLPLVRFEKGDKRGFRKLRIGAVFSGGPAAGGHNVLWGIGDALEKMGSSNEVYGFLGGALGLIEGKGRLISKEELSLYRNQGGFDLLGSGRTKIEKEEELERVRQHVEALQLDGVVIIGGDDSNTNAALLANFFLKKGCKTCVVGVPKTIDGDLQNPYVPLSFGFDTACKTYAELIGNIGKDALSSKKYTHFIRLMGRSASHIVLECALATQPNLALIGEEKKTLGEVVLQIADLVEKREAAGKKFSVIVLPEGLIEFMPDVGALLQEISQKGGVKDLTASSREVWGKLPEKIQKQLLLERDPHGNVSVSSIATEELVVEMVKKELERRKKGASFSSASHFFGYEGRCALPTNFDATYGYTLGYIATLLIEARHTGYMAFVENLGQTSSSWQIGGVPLPTLMQKEKRKGKEVAVIAKALVDFQSAPYKTWKEVEKKVALDDAYLSPGPIQFFGEKKYTDSIPLILSLGKK